MIKVLHGDCLELMKSIGDGDIDLVMTSPPYDNLRNYNNSLEWSFEIFQEVANELYRVLKKGGVIIWVVGDSTIKGSETGTSFRQALYFKDIGFNIHDTMIYSKKNYIPMTHKRYEQKFEYMFCLSKGKPETFNPIMLKCLWGGTQNWGKPAYYKDGSDKLTAKPKNVVKTHKIHPNIFEYATGSTKTGKTKHPAVFPLQLAIDQISTWSNETDIVLDPFLGSGTTGIACKNLNRHFIGIEKEQKYYDIARERISSIQKDHNTAKGH